MDRLWTTIVTLADETNQTSTTPPPPPMPPDFPLDQSGLDLTVFQRFASNRRVNDAAFISLILAYCVLIVIGTIGNSLVVYVVARQPAMRTARNVFVVNLAVSDLLLCLITMPLTLMEILSNTWPLGNSPVSCKMVGSLQAVSIFVSTLSITAIALDRYQLIVYPTKRSFQLTGALLALAGIWAIGVILAMPLFIVRTLQHFDIPAGIKSPIRSIDYCLEDWSSEKGRSIYSASSILVQYALPIVTVSVAHARICHKLRFRMASMQQHQLNNKQATTNEAAPADGRKAAREEQLRKTNTLLMAIAIIFTICWLPMNIFNVVVDTWNVFGDDTETMLIVYAVCHMVGMSSACANPLLYGWLNDNFRKEFQKIGASFRRNNNKPAVSSAHQPKNVRSAVAAQTVVQAIGADNENVGPSTSAAVTTNVVLLVPSTAKQNEIVTAVTHHLIPEGVASGNGDPSDSITTNHHNKNNSPQIV